MNLPISALFFRFTSLVMYQAHERSLCGPSEQCDQCGRIFKFAITLERHKKRAHTESKYNGPYSKSESLTLQKQLPTDPKYNYF